MKKPTVTMLTLLATILATAAPVYFAIPMATKLSLDAQSSTSMLYARDILHRSEMSASRAKAAFDKLASFDGEPCSEAAVTLMREVDLNSSYLQAVGYYENDHLLCSSLGINERFEVMLGPLDLVTSNGVGIRKNFSFDFATSAPFIVLSNSSHVANHPQGTPLDTTTREEGVVLGVYSLDVRQELTTSAPLKPQ